MNPIEQFNTERTERIASYGKDLEFQALTQTWLRESMARQYVYNFTWLGRPIIQYPQDMQAMQELVWATRPDLIIETGIAHGGSLILSASLLALLDLTEAARNDQAFHPCASPRKVIGVDIDIRAHNHAAICAHPLAYKIQMIQGSSIAPDTIEQVRAAAQGYERVMVCLDSMHTHAHVLAELDAYAPLVSVGSYCVVFDTFVEDLPQNFFKDRPWNPGNNPKTAVHAWLADHPNFQIDASLPHKLMATAVPDGFLRRTN